MTHEQLVRQGFSQIEGAPEGAVVMSCRGFDLEVWPEFINRQLGSAKLQFVQGRNTVVLPVRVADMSVADLNALINIFSRSCDD